VAISTEEIRVLRERTGAGIMDVKRALETANGDQKQAELALREKGLTKAASKGGRTTAEGVVDSYIHGGGRIGAMIELNCETDFVARTPEFMTLAHNIAMQVAAMGAIYIETEDQPKDDISVPEEVCLMPQSFIKDSSKTIADLIMDVRARVGENIKVSRITRFGLGE
jgi:elongation factor Ts